MEQIRHIFSHLYKNSLRKFAAILMILFSITTLFSQQKISFKWSAFQKVRKYSQAVFLFQYHTGYGVIVKSSPKFHGNLSNFLINFYDTNFIIKEQRSLIFNKNKEKVLDIWYYKNRIFFITQADLPNQRVAARLRIIRTDTLSALIIQNDLLILNKTHFSRDLAFHLSRKDSSLGLWHVNPAESEEARQSITSYTYNNEMKLLDKAIIDLPEKAELCKVLRVDDIDNGEFLIYTKEYAIRPLEKRGFSPNYKFVFYISNPSKETLKYFDFKTEKAYLERGRLKWKDGILEAAGLFMAKTDGPKIGIWFVKYNFNTQAMLLDTIQHFDKKVTTLPNNGFQSSLIRNSKLESFYLDYFIKLNSKDRIIVTEQFFLLPASIGSSYTYNRFYGDILLLYINENGRVYNAQRIIKAQQTFNNFGEFSSYYLERKDSVFQFFYNDNAKNTGTNKYKQLVWHRHSSLTLNEVTEHSITKYSLADYKQIGGIIQVRDMEKLAPNKYLVYANKYKKGKLGVMRLE